MKDKERITIMVTTAADGWQAPLAIIGKLARPRCFNLVNRCPIAYMNQRNAWFDQRVMSWWISSVFLPAHRKRSNGVFAILILDNFSGHNIDFSQFSDRLIVIFFAS